MKLIKNYYLSRIKEVNILEVFNIRKAVLKAAQGMILFFIICYLFYDRIWLWDLICSVLFPIYAVSGQGGEKDADQTVQAGI